MENPSVTLLQIHAALSKTCQVWQATDSSREFGPANALVESEDNVAIPIITTAIAPTSANVASITELRSIIVFTPFPIHESMSH